MIRELFVEVAESLLEGAMREREARERKKAEAIAQVNADLERLATERLPLDFTHAIRLIVEQARPRWKLHDVAREAHDRQILLRVRMPCGHLARIWLDELNLAFQKSTAEVVDYIYEEIEREPRRRCFCVQREALQPCVPGECR